MAAKQQKNTYTAAEVAVLEEAILKQKEEIEELKLMAQASASAPRSAPAVPESYSPARPLPQRYRYSSAALRIQQPQLRFRPGPLESSVGETRLDNPLAAHSWITIAQCCARYSSRTANSSAI